ncbi:MAG: hypothetical protein AABY22_11980 [Nanoarchaeota archaeon]
MKKIRIKNCETCGKEFNYGRHPETKTCSKVCFKKLRKSMMNNIIKKMEETNMNKYGVRHSSQRKEHKEMVIKTWKNKPIEEKEDINKRRIKTHNLKSEKEKQEIKDKRSKTKLDLYGHHAFNNTKKSKKTNLKKFGTPYYLGSNQHKELLKERALKTIELLFENNDLKLMNKYIGKSNKNNKKIYYTIQCLKCNNEFKSTIDFNKIDGNTQENGSLTICRKCYPIHSNSKIQRDISIFLDSLNIKYEESVRNLISPFEIDILIPDHKLGIEINGNYWHSEIGGGKNRLYHLNKTRLCNKQEIKLIHIFEDEWISKKDIIKSMILNNLGLIKNKIYARNCTIKEISGKEKTNFINKNHIQGDSPDKIRLGLFHKNELMSVMTFNKENRNKKNININNWELSRFCSKKYYIITGSFSKLLKYFTKIYKPLNIMTYADIRWSGLNIENIIYTKNKFNFSHNTKPNYWYVDKTEYLKRHHRFKYRKKVLLKIFGKKYKDNTEWEIAQLNNMDRIWDCGSIKFILTFI